MKVTVKSSTTSDPISLIGGMAGFCYGSDTTDQQKNYKRGLSCISDNHGRTLEFPQVYLEISGISARVARELYTHIGGSPTRLQASTRYINYNNFDYITPKSISTNADADEVYKYTMQEISESLVKLRELGVSQEDSANLLPLGMETSMVLRTNLRNLIDMSRQRLCQRAYWEFRELMETIIESLGNYSQEWAELVYMLKVFKPKCEEYGYCQESRSCGRYGVRKNNV